MIDPENQSFPEQEDKKRGWFTRGIAGIVLFAILCGAVSAPLALYIRWRENRESQSINTEPEEVVPDSPVVSFDDYRIALITIDNQLVTMAPDGSDERILTDDEGSYRFPAWSPDGLKLAVIGGASLYLYSDLTEEEANHESVALYSNRSQPPFYIYWSPNSQKLSFLANHPQGIALHLSSLNEGDSRQIAIGQPFYWDWSPESDQLLIHTGGFNENSSLAVLDAGGSESSADVADPGRFQAPGISDSGRFWAYAELTSEGISRIVVEVRGEEILLEESHFGQAFMTWSPVDDKLAFASPALGSQSRYGPLILYETGSGLISTIVNDQVVAFFWSPDGTQIAYLTIAEPAPVDTQTASASKGRFSRRIIYQQPVIDLNLQVVDLNSRETRWLTTFKPSAIFVTQFLPFFDQYALSHLVWSPDGNFLTIPMIKEGVEVISLITVSDGSVRELAEGKLGFWRPN